MEGLNTGVENTAAAEQTMEETTETTQETTETQQTQSGVEEQSAAETNENVEKAFAARLKAATEKARQEAIERAKQEAEKSAQDTAQKAKDELIASMNYEWKGKKITTETEYKQALQEKEIEDGIRKKYENLPDEVVNEIIENRKFREQFQAKEKELQKQEKARKAKEEYEARKVSMYDEFASEFSDYVNDSEKMKSIPKEVWMEANKWLDSGGKEGRRLSDALIRHIQKEQLLQSQTNDANIRNASNSTGSVKSSGENQPFFTQEQVENMSRTEIRNNYDAIQESKKHWK